MKLLKVLLVIALLVISTSSYCEKEAEDTQPITLAKFNEKYREYQAKMKECAQRLGAAMVKDCEDEENKKFRTITHRGVNCEVIDELSCQKGKFGQFDVIIGGEHQEVTLPC